MDRIPPQQSNYQRAILEKIEDPVSCELMTRAVTIVPCGHTLNEDTVTQCLADNKLCPIDRQPIERYIPNYTVRHLAETVDSPPQEEESYSPEAETHFLKGKTASEQGNMEGAIEALLEALRLSPCYEKAQSYLEFCLKTAHPPSAISTSPENTSGKREEKETKREIENGGIAPIYFDPASKKADLTLNGILRSLNIRTEEELKHMSEDDKRNTLIVEISNRKSLQIPYLQSKNNFELMKII